MFLLSTKRGTLHLDYFLSKYTIECGKAIKGFSRKAKDVLVNYAWPGNVRELQNTVKYAVTMEITSLIQADNLPHHLRFGELNRQLTAGDPGDNKVVPLRDLERQALWQAIELFGDSYEGKVRAAQALGIHVVTLYRKLKQF